MVRSSVQSDDGFYDTTREKPQLSEQLQRQRKAIVVAAAMGLDMTLVAFLAEPWEDASVMQGAIVLAAQMSALRGKENTLRLLPYKSALELECFRQQELDEYRLANGSQLVGLDSPLTLALTSHNLECVRAALANEGEAGLLYLTAKEGEQDNQKSKRGATKSSQKMKKSQKRQRGSEDPAPCRAMLRAACVGNAAALAVMMEEVGKRSETTLGHRELAQLLYLAMINGHEEAAGCVAREMQRAKLGLRKWLEAPQNPHHLPNYDRREAHDLLVQLHCRSASGLARQIAGMKPTVLYP